METAYTGPCHSPRGPDPDAGGRAATVRRSDDLGIRYAFDWKIIFYLQDQEYVGAVGRTGARTRAEVRVIEALQELPEGVVARGEIACTELISDPCLRHVVGVADRGSDGSITWSMLRPDAAGLARGILC